MTDKTSPGPKASINLCFELLPDTPECLQNAAQFIRALPQLLHHDLHHPPSNLTLTLCRRLTS